MAEFMKPADNDRYTQQQNLAVFHLRTAAKIARDIAEGHAQRGRDGAQEVRGPNVKYRCTAGPNGKPCRYCTLRAFRALQKYREERGMQPPPYPVMSINPERPCPCQPCQDNRCRVFEATHGKPAVSDDEMDRRALEWLKDKRT